MPQSSLNLSTGRSELLDTQNICAIGTPQSQEYEVAKSKRKQIRKPYTAADIKLLKQHSKARTPVAKIARVMRRSEGSLRQKALALGIGLGHQR
jgi:isocitrate lyase